MIKKYWLYILVLFIEGASLMAVEIMGAKLVSPFYGSSLYVWTSVLGVAILGLSLGYYTGGRLSQGKHSQSILFKVLALSSVLVFVLPYSADYIMNLTSVMNMKLGVLVCSILLLLPPLFCFGMVGPLMVRLMAGDFKELGNVAGTVYFISTFGGIVATFVFALYLIPQYGLKMCSLVTAIALAILPLIYIILRKSGKIKQDRAVGGDITITKKQESSKQENLKRSVYLFAVLEGAVVMAVELLVARMLNPFFGSSLYVWGAVIGVTLTSLALGYYFGGRVADKYTSLRSLYWVLLMSSVFIFCMHFLSKSLSIGLGDLNPVVAVVIISCLLLLPALLLLGMVPTLLIRLMSRKIDYSGKTTGMVFTLSSSSGIISLLVMGFYIIPEFGLAKPSVIIGMLLGIIPFVMLVRNKKYLSFIFIIVLIISLSALNKKEVKSKDVKLKYMSEGLLGQVMVVDLFKYGKGAAARKINDRVLFVNRMGQTFIDRNSGASRWGYINYVSAIGSKLPENSNALLLGLGGGTVANMLHNYLKFNVDAVELDQRIIDVARKYFSLNMKVNVILDDARHYIETTEKKYDLIIFDVFKGETPPSHVLSLESFKTAKTLLTDSGFLIVNFNGFIHGDVGIPNRSLYKTLREAGLDVLTIPTEGTEENRNTLYICKTGGVDLSNVRNTLSLYGKEVNLNDLTFNMDSVKSNKDVIFVDDRPDLEKLNIPAARSWRKGYTENYTMSFIENGIPLFE